MDIRIEIHSDGDSSTIQVSGNLKGQGIVELERLCQETTGQLLLDLSNLRSSGTEGLQLIRKLTIKGAKISGVSPYMALMLSE